MPQDKRTKEFKDNRLDRLKNHEAGKQFTPDQIIENPQVHQETPDRCIWCDYQLDGVMAICIQCRNCQSCGLLIMAGGTDFCYLCGNTVPENKLIKEVPNFRRIRGVKGFQMQKRERPFLRPHNRGKSDKENMS